ncbi:MAG: hypothetical protein AAF388_17875 [Bacteroidota bacterium]
MQPFNPPTIGGEAAALSKTVLARIHNENFNPNRSLFYAYYGLISSCLSRGKMWIPIGDLATHTLSFRWAGAVWKVGQPESPGVGLDPG